ncbi:hypothetical protein MtrunA17_Chr8g0372011 [Medicago truncatula]|uniref:Uncharacterized protein n=1 Tax=Medicago truncatula TaxID=3880 RepID=A0A396GLM4_MEDTR|nr:hypothetical protein MtrunA17_Chr8g0372011 [Medicago truncatula]
MQFALTIHTKEGSNTWWRSIAFFTLQIISTLNQKNNEYFITCVVQHHLDIKFKTINII